MPPYENCQDCLSIAHDAIKHLTDVYIQIYQDGLAACDRLENQLLKMADSLRLVDRKLSGVVEEETLEKLRSLAGILSCSRGPSSDKGNPVIDIALDLIRRNLRVVSTDLLEIIDQVSFLYLGRGLPPPTISCNIDVRCNALSGSHRL